MPGHVTTLNTMNTTNIPRFVRPLLCALVLLATSIPPLAEAAPKPKKDALPAVLVAEDELEQLRPAAEAGDAAAQVKPGHYYMSTYEEGYANEATAGEWFRKAAEAGDADGMAWYAIYLVMTAPHATREDAARAEPWARQAAEKGSAIGQYTMGMLNSTSPVEERELWHSMAAKQGFVPSIRALAQITFRQKQHEMNNKKNPVSRKTVKTLARGVKGRDVDTFILLVRASLSSQGSMHGQAVGEVRAHGHSGCQRAPVAMV